LVFDKVCALIQINRFLLLFDSISAILYSYDLDFLIEIIF
jgi:hypothetical protein